MSRKLETSVTEESSLAPFNLLAQIPLFEERSFASLLLGNIFIYMELSRVLCFSSCS